MDELETFPADSTQRKMLQVSLDRMIHASQDTLSKRVPDRTDAILAGDEVEKLDLVLAHQVIALEDRLIELEGIVKAQRESVLSQLKPPGEQDALQMVQRVELQLENVDCEVEPMMKNIQNEVTLDSVVELLAQLKKKLQKSTQALKKQKVQE
jgi:hypothetical protein